MKKIAVLGRTGLAVNKDGFGALPVQRVARQDAVALLRNAEAKGIDFIDTARAYSDSEEKLGLAFGGAAWQKLVLATKTAATTEKAFWQDLETSLRLLKIDTIDIYQLHNPGFCPKPGDGTGLYEAMQKARQQGKIRFIGITNHRLKVAEEAVESGLYDTLQFPFNYLSSPQEQALVRRCAEKDVGFIAMKALSGGLITDVAASRAWLLAYENAVPIWGIQQQWELDALLAAMGGPDTLTDAQQAQIEKDIRQLAGEFCRGCGYCLPCPAEIEINNCARMSLLLRRSPAAGWLTPEWQARMARIEGCINCGQCKARCPYGLDTPNLLKRNYADYQTFL